MRIAVDEIKPNPDQPRQHFDQTALEELAESIKQQGLIQPIAVRPNGTGYIIIHGERRWRAHKLAGLTEIEATILDVDDITAYTMSVIENEQREDITPIETATALNRMMTEQGLSQGEVARRISKDRTWVAQKLRLLNLPDEVKDSIKSGGLSEGHARQLLKLNGRVDDDRLIAIANEAVTGKWNRQRIEAEVNREIVSQDTPGPNVSQDTPAGARLDTTSPVSIGAFKVFWRSLTPAQQQAAKAWLEGGCND